MPALVLGAIGIVYGDIGTSVLYAIKEIFGHGHVPFTIENVYGMLSMIFWTMTIIVSLKYVVLVLRADNEGEGGLVAMLALASRAVADKPRLRNGMLALGIFGTALFYGDGVITPAISVLSAVEGLEVVSPHFTGYVIPITLVVLFCLFAVQKRGTAGIGRFFGPITLTWFGVLALLGVAQILTHPEILKAVSPHYMLRFIWDNPGTSFIILGATVLCVTGAEALYADMGHFGKGPIRIAWFSVVMPALVLNYFGQGALVLADPQAVDNPFFRLFPSWALLPVVGLAAMATVIASQAVISGAFSLTAQAMRLGYLPRMRVVQTSGESIGQVYVPVINWLLMVGVLLLVLGFRSSSALSAAYGIAVSITMVTTTLLAGLVAWRLWHWNRVAVLLGVIVFVGVDLAFVVANTLKVADGGWLTLAVAVVAMVLFSTWAKGVRLTRAELVAELIPLPDFVDSLVLEMPFRARGTAVFLTADALSVPHALLHNLHHNQVLHEQVFVMQMLACETPRVPARERIEAQNLGHGIWAVKVRYGFMEPPNVPEFVRMLAYQKGLAVESMATSYFISRASLGRRRLPAFSGMRQALFSWLQRNAGRASDYFHLPENRLVEMGQRL